MAETKEKERMTYTVEEAAQLLGIGRMHAYNLANRGELPGVIRLGRRFVVSKAVIDLLVANPSKPIS